MSTLEKHFFTDPTHLVISSLRSLTLTNPSLAFDEPNKIIYRRPTPELTSKPKVSIISGGGSGHEPGFAGFVGKGMLTAGVAGTIFASPSAEQVRRAVLSRVPTEKGVMVVTMNYTGDVLNFGMAVEKARASGVKAEFLALCDDVGVGRAKGGKVGRRGIAGSVLVMKMIGAAAELGCDLPQVHTLAKLAVDSIVSVGSSMEHVHVPGRGPMESLMPAGDIEVGMGIHNEPGSQTVQASLPDLVKIMLAQLLDPSDKDRHYVDVKPSDQVVLFVNNLGGVSCLEIGGIVTELVKQLKETYSLTPVRVIAGTFLTSLNGLGFSATILKLQDTGLGPGKSMLDLLDYPAEAVGWAAPIPVSTWEAAAHTEAMIAKNGDGRVDEPTAKAAPKSSSLRLDPKQAATVLKAGLDSIIAVEPEVTRYDTIVGDGDCGIGLKRGAEAVLKELLDNNAPADVVQFINRIATVVENNMDGTSGALYAIFLNALTAGLLEQDQRNNSSGSSSGAADSSSSNERAIDAHTWAAALKWALHALGNYTPAVPGDRTLIDSLVPFVDELAASGDVKKAAQAARGGAEKTKAMKASLGRTVYVGSEDEWVGKVPDPGAWGLAAFFDGLAGAFYSQEE
ncbi:hypothetical protein DV738_g4411, partial [Chaetothyriales sp. CBS 135597]